MRSYFSTVLIIKPYLGRNVESVHFCQAYTECVQTDCKACKLILNHVHRCAIHTLCSPADDPALDHDRLLLQCWFSSEKVPRHKADYYFPISKSVLESRIILLGINGHRGPRQQVHMVYESKARFTLGSLHQRRYMH